MPSRSRSVKKKPDSAPTPPTPAKGAVHSAIDQTGCRAGFLVTRADDYHALIAFVSSMQGDGKDVAFSIAAHPEEPWRLAANTLSESPQVVTLMASGRQVEPMPAFVYGLRCYRLNADGKALEEDDGWTPRPFCPVLFEEMRRRMPLPKSFTDPEKQAMMDLKAAAREIVDRANAFYGEDDSFAEQLAGGLYHDKPGDTPLQKDLQSTLDNFNARSDGERRAIFNGWNAEFADTASSIEQFCPLRRVLEIDVDGRTLEAGFTHIRLYETNVRLIIRQGTPMQEVFDALSVLYRNVPRLWPTLITDPMLILDVDREGGAA